MYFLFLGPSFFSDIGIMLDTKSFGSEITAEMEEIVKN
jgi:hypothetical protein